MSLTCIQLQDSYAADLPHQALPDSDGDSAYGSVDVSLTL